MHWSHLPYYALYEHWAHLGSLQSYRTIVNLYCYGIIGTPASTCGGGGKSFDPPRMPTPSSLQTTMPEEPFHPKSCLTIHTTILVNFKHCAGWREIRPLREVRTLQSSNSWLISFHFTPTLTYCTTKWIWRIQCYRCSVVLLKCSSPKSLRSYTILQDIWILRSVALRFTSGKFLT